MSGSSQYPSVLVVSCSSTTSAEDIIKGTRIIGDTLSCIEYLDNEIEAYTWNLDTKYYNTVVRLCAPKHRIVPSQEFADTVEAVILHFDARERDTFSLLQMWVKTIDDLYSPSVKLIICDSYDEKDGVTKDELDRYTINNDCELIQLVPTEVDSDEEEFGSVHGFPRIRSALHAHSWSNLKMKSLPRRKNFSDDVPGIARESEKEPEVIIGQEGTPPEFNDTSDAEDSFSQLFSRLHDFRTTAAALNSNSRRDFAEKVAKQFLKALDSDSDEVSE